MAPLGRPHYPLTHLPGARVLHKGDRGRYRVTRTQDGEIILTARVVSLTDRELALLANPGIVESIRQGIAEAHEGKVVRYEPGHFSKALAEDGIDPPEPDED